MPSRPVLDELLALHPRRFPPGSRRDRYSLGDRNSFAFCFWLAGDRARAAEEFHRIGPYMSELPWGFLRGGSLAGFTRAREACTE